MTWKVEYIFPVDGSYIIDFFNTKEEALNFAKGLVMEGYGIIKIEEVIPQKKEVLENV